MSSRPIRKEIDEQVRIPPHGLDARLQLPAGAQAIVLFAHGSGSTHRSPRNRAVAEQLREVGLGTLLFDLLTPTEAMDRRNVFDIPLLADRLLLATEWLDESWQGGSLALGYFGASTGAAAALVAAANAARPIGAVVSRGGRPDLAGEFLERVEAPTLLIVGGEDREVLRLNRDALRLLNCEKALEVVPGATHLFEEPGTLDCVTRLAADWFMRYLEMREVR